MTDLTIQPEPAGPAPSRWKKNVLMIAAVAGMFYFFFWNSVYRPDRVLLEERIAEGERLLQAVHAATANWSEIEEEKRRVAEQLAELRRAVPDELEVETFLTELEAWAGARGVDIADVDYEKAPADLFDRARIRLRFSGDGEAVARLRESRSELERLSEWTVADDGSQTVVIYAFPKPAPKADRNPCVEVDSRPVPWPFSQRLSERREVLERICEELGRNADRIEQIGAYRDLAEEAEMLKQFVTSIRAPE